MVIPASKYTTVDEADKKVIEVQKQYMDGAITNGERSNKVIQMWSAVTDQVADEMFGNMKKRGRRRSHEPDLHHGRLRRPRFEAADSPALAVCAD